MIPRKRTLPEDYGQKYNIVSTRTERFPFYVKECGYCSKKGLSFGKANNYSDYLLLYSLLDIASFSKERDVQYVPQDSIIVTACNTPLNFSKAGKDWSCFYIIIGGSHAKLYYNIIRNKSCVFANNQLSGILDYFIEIYELDYYDELYANMRASLLIHNIFFELFQISAGILETKKITPAQEIVVNIAIKYIAKNYKNDMSVDAICSEVGFSKYYFCKLFKKQMGITIHQYVSEFRINKSKELLTYSKLSINSIARNVGFKNTLTYSRCFERSTHMTPTEYRKYF